MKKVGIGILVLTISMVIAFTFIWNGRKESIPYPPAAPFVVDIEFKPPVPTAPEPIHLPSLSDPSESKDTERDVEDVTVQAAPMPETIEEETTAPKNERAWYADEQMQRLLERDPEYLAQWRRGIQGWIGGRMGRASHIEIYVDEVEPLTELFQEATIEFCKMWHPIIQEGLAQPGEARDRVAMLHAASPNMTLMLYAMPAKSNELSSILGPERYDKLHASLNADFLRWFHGLRKTAETIRDQ